MADLNKVFLIGRLTHDPELRYTTNGSAVTDLRIATSRRFTTKEGERREETLYIDVTVWNRTAENCCQFLKKGRQIHVEGYLKTESWDDRTTGEKRSKTKVEAEQVQFLDRRDDAGPSASGDDEQAPARRPAESRGPSNGPARGNYTPAPAPRRPQPGPPAEAEDNDDIPF